MIEEPTASIHIWMLLSAALGFIAGDMCGDSYRHRKCLEQANADLSAQLNHPQPSNHSLDQELKHQRVVIHDIHKQISAETRSFPKRPL